MEGSKNAMYAQAGRSHGWTQGLSDNYAQPKTQAVSPAPVAPVMPAMPVVPVMPVMPVMPEMPVAHTKPAVPHPAPPVIMPPEDMKPEKNCQTIGIAHIPMQKWQELYEPDQGFTRGTLFAELDFPFVGEGACKHE